MINEDTNLCPNTNTKDEYLCYLDSKNKANAEIYNLPVCVYSATKIICTSGGGNDSDYNLRLFLKYFGSPKKTTPPSNVTFSYKFDLLSISPIIGRGTLLTITGSYIVLTYN